jgi:3-dehydroquinate dehydratase type I
VPVPSPTLARAAPLLVGVVDSAEALARCAGGGLAAGVDLVEARVDLFDDPAGTRAAWLDACARVEAAGVPVLVTIRLAAEGGRWAAPDLERLPLFRAAVDVASWVDVEAQSAIAADVTALAHARGRTAVVSHHDFARTPALAELARIAAACRAAGADVVKVATLVAGAEDRAALFALLAQASGTLCVIGMGAESEELRVALPAQGSMLAYGFLERPTAPGQTSAAALDARLRAAVPAYAERRRPVASNLQ